MGSSNASAAATILLVEDELMVRDLMVTILTRSGHKVLVAATAAEARRLFLDASDAIDLVVTDVSLPDGDGMRLAEEFRTRRPSLKVICTSGSFAAPAGPRAEGPTLFLEKPFSAASLSQAIRQMLDA